MDPRTVAVFAAAAEAIHASIESHNRAREMHRRQVRRLYPALEEIRRECKRLGINLEITQTPRRESQ